MNCARKKWLLTVALLTAAVLVFATSAQAGQVLSLNMSGGGSGMGATIVAGVPGTIVEVDNWNNLIVPTSGTANYVGSVSGTLKLSDGTTAAGTAVNWNWNGYHGSGTANDLFRANWDPFGTTPDVNLSVTNIPFARYDVIVYAPSADYTGADRGGEIIANGQSRLLRMFKTYTDFPKYVESTATGPYTPPSSGVPEATYVRYTGLTGDLTVTTDSKFGDRLRIAGLQIIDPNVHVGGEGTLGTLALDATLTGGTLVTPLAGARVIRISQNVADFIHFDEVQAFEEGTGTNVAPAGTATQSTTYGGLVAQRAIDDDDATWNHTESSSTEWLRIELAGSTTLTLLTIHNRDDSCQSRARDVQVKVYGDVAETQLLFDQQVLGLDVSPYQEDVILGLLTGATSVGAMDPFADYNLELGNSETSDQIVVPLLPLADSTELQVAGDLVVSSIGSSLQVGDTFQLLVADTFTGSFSSITLPEVPGIGGWDTSRLYIDGTITAVPEPASIALLAFGGAAVWLCYRRKRLRARP